MREGRNKRGGIGREKEKRTAKQEHNRTKTDKDTTTLTVPTLPPSLVVLRGVKPGRWRMYQHMLGRPPLLPDQT